MFRFAEKVVGLPSFEGSKWNRDGRPTGRGTKQIQGQRTGRVFWDNGNLLVAAGV